MGNFVGMNDQWIITVKVLGAPNGHVIPGEQRETGNPGDITGGQCCISLAASLRWHDGADLVTMGMKSRWRRSHGRLDRTLGQSV